LAVFPPPRPSHSATAELRELLNSSIAGLFKSYLAHQSTFGCAKAINLLASILPKKLKVLLHPYRNRVRWQK
jgi:hypothetical protein